MLYYLFEGLEVLRILSAKIDGFWNVFKPFMPEISK